MGDRILERAQAGDPDAFRDLVEPYRRELQLHCYRILGSLQDAEDALQDTLLAAWRAVETFEARSSVRAWLYRIATNRCLNALRDGARRPRTVPSRADRPAPTRIGEPLWIEPYPDLLLDDVPEMAPGPEARYEIKEAVGLAFVTALQQLPPRQRAALVLRDALGFRAAEVAEMLDTTEDSVTGALKRARAAVDQRLGLNPPAPGSARERMLADRFAEAFQRGNVADILALLSDDAWLTMPPLPVEYQGHAAIANFLDVAVFQGGALHYQLVPTRANRQPAYGIYLHDPHQPIAHAHGLIVLTLDGDRVTAITGFIDNSVLPHFALPRTLHDNRPHNHDQQDE